MLNTNQVSEQLQSIAELTKAKKFVIAYSGGLDSHVLLQLCSEMPAEHFSFRAIHINHGLQKEANSWASHCKIICESLNIPFQSHDLKLKSVHGESLEEVARIKRYAQLFQSLASDEVLLTAHHQNDQAETLLLNLFRGAGVNGLSAMPVIKSIRKDDKSYFHARPLLNQPYEDLVQYAARNRLDYIQDPSNFDESFDRNFLRNNIMPQLRQRWPGIDKTLSRAADIQSETRSLLNDYATEKLESVLGKNNTILIPELLKHNQVVQKLLIRIWIEKQDVSMPSGIKLKHLFSDVIFAQDDAKPLLEWSNAQIRRYKDKLYLMSVLSEHDETQVIDWDGKRDLPIESLSISLKADDLQSTAEALSIRFRQGGEKIYSEKRACRISLKNLFQEYEVPPWERSRIPLVYNGDKLIQVIGFEDVL